MTAVDAVLAEVRQERARQHRKWGQQDHPDLSERHREMFEPGEELAARLCSVLGVPRERLAKERYERAADLGVLTWPDILIEEICEWVEAIAHGDHALARREIVQVAAVATQIAEAMDRRDVEFCGEPYHDTETLCEKPAGHHPKSRHRWHNLSW